VPPAIRAFLDSDDYESAVRIAVSLGGDSDTLACITGGIAEAFYKEIPQEIIRKALTRLSEPLLQILENFADSSFYADLFGSYKAKLSE
jgi:ADP-ribosylglycohydrolase